MTILDNSGRLVAPPQRWADDLAEFHDATLMRFRLDALVYVLDNPRAALRGRDVREAFAGEVPVSPELSAELAMGRRS